MFNADVLTRAALALTTILGGLVIYLLYNWTLKLRTRDLLADLGLRGNVHPLRARPSQVLPLPGYQRSG